ncbi:RrF2 family transcriptional regulator [Cohnella nanjingensis]|uniref:Rrf2 family transcriptional regulator n=1 Tax=Cohnella nanjingensis TaxID=1387779 RepID=A0A7X0VGM5_9BACL|nr:Rrf2 family transcriptional regulator [Cohnella nanjingensis]MBB6673252.1 Rrf2 family transcriptional regulator [Cohnella nanjingensis]
MATERCGGVATPRWFGFALQSLVYLAHHADNGTRCPSGEIAGKCYTEATLMRRILARLARAQIVEAREGRDGGYFLKKPPSEITLAEVYRALEMTDPLYAGMMDTASCGPIGQEMRDAFTEVVQQSEQMMMEQLGRKTIADLIRQVYG